MPFSCIPFFACNRQVDFIDRRQCNLHVVPHDIDRNARTLEEVYLDCNHIKDLDKPLFRCRKLRTLSASENEIIRVPPEIANLAYLEELNLKSNDISDLPEEIKECGRLKILDLSSNPITRLPLTISLLTSMIHLGLNDVSLTQMPHDIGLLKNLRSLEVRENLLRSIPPSISQLDQLQRLDLGHNELDDLPNEIGLLSNLEELYVDQNDLEVLPETIVQCRALEQLDASENKLMVLPDEIGDLEQLNDLTIAQNCLQTFPSSIGRLKKLAILKADRNAITQITPAIGSCSSLTEIYLTENLLTEIPSSIGNLKTLRTLNLDKNQLKELPSTIGGCTSLRILSLRDNLIEQLPLEIGRLENLRVLDVCNNRLNYLPFTINVLFKLQALWLSENQSQALLKLQTEQDPRTGIKVLTCYSLPQSSAHLAERSQTNRSFIGGPKVHFGSDLEEGKEEDEEGGSPIGQFARHDTPHPKPHTHAPKFKKQSIDGHIIHHDEDQSGKPPTLTLNSGRKRSNSDEGGSGGVRTISPSTGGAASLPQPMPRSALKHPSVPPTSFYPTTSEVHVESGKSNEQITSALAQTFRVKVRRDENGGLGLSIAGGLESTPYKDDDNGLFVSKLAEGGPAQLAGLKVGDKILRVDNTDVVNVRHQIAVTTMQEAGDVIELTILRESDKPSLSKALPQVTPSKDIDGSLATLDAEPSSSKNSMTKEVISTSIKRDSDGSPGFAVAGGKGMSGSESIVISSITAGGAADRVGKLHIGDRVLSINGVNMRGARHDQAVSLLTGHSDKEIYLVVQRDPVNSAPSPISATANSQKTLTPVIYPAGPPSQSTSPIRMSGFGDTSWDGKIEEVELVRDGHSLGLSIVGGSDHSSHPFGINSPGVFISKITPNSPAGRCQRLRVGDRILSVNKIDISTARHQTAVEALKQSENSILLKVLHESQPVGLRDVVVRRSVGEPLGINICGGIGSRPSNPLDKTDEGIFIEKVERGGAASNANLVPGLRILEVNDESLLGCSQEEAARILRRSGTLVRLLICDAFSSTFNNSIPEQGASGFATNTISANNTSVSKREVIEKTDNATKPTNSNIVLPSTGLADPSHSSLAEVDSLSPVEVSVQIKESIDDSSIVSKHPISIISSNSNTVSLITSVDGPSLPVSSSLSTSNMTMNNPSLSTSPIMPAVSNATLSQQRIAPPPVAPKPRSFSKNDDTFQNGLATSVATTPPTYTHPERLEFSSKLRKFEHEIEVKRPGSATNTTNYKAIPPAKKPLISEEDVKKMKEEESRKMGASGKVSWSPAEDEDISSSFEHILNNSAVPRSMPAVVRTKKAENRILATSPSPTFNEPLNSVEQRALEHQKRQQWRQARYKSLEADSAAADKIMQQVEQINSRLTNISEETNMPSSPPPQNERILHNETSVERNEYVDPKTGAKTVSLIERSVTQREVNASPLLSVDVNSADMIR